VVFALAAVAMAAPVCAGGAEASGALVRFDRYSPLSTNAEIARRMLSPLDGEHLRDILARSGKALAPQPVDLAGEAFALYVPSRTPPHGYGLIVFVPPWQDARLPPEWKAALDERGLIFVSADRSGNDATDLGRRAPLALIGAENVMRRYPVDPDRVFVAGFSGGARVAMRLAVAYPDLFRAGLLIAGSDPLGEGGIPPPGKDLLWRLQAASRLVFVSGELDAEPQASAGAAASSLRRLCMDATDTQVIPRVGHAMPDPAALSKALDDLERPVRPDPAALAACRAALERDVDASLAKARSLSDGGRRAEAQRALVEVDRRFGGLAAPSSVELYRRLEAPAP
jgi:dienelactone hydrolase